ncbi:hypothetical protein Leryth_025195 [Lithospermum erythrorhizon]|nr:hypothetical protein Leryth_025195 [Lithospermum erythrorhizon]
MGKASKRSKKEDFEEEDDEIKSDFEIDSDDMNNGMLLNARDDSVSDYDEDELDGHDNDDEEDGIEDNDSDDDDDDDDEVGEREDDASDAEGEVEEEEYDNNGDEDDDDMNSDEVGRLNAKSKGAVLEELEKEVMDIRHNEKDLLRNLKRHKDEDVLKGQAVKNQKALWDRALECRFLLQRAFSNSNRLPQEPIRSLFNSSSDDIGEAYSSLINSSKKTLDSILELQEALLEKNPAIDQSMGVNQMKHSINIETSEKTNEETDDEEWATISQMQSRMASFRDKSIDKWHRKTQVTSGAAAIKGKLEAFNQNISGQVAAYMRDPTKMIKGMQQNRSAIALFGSISDPPGNLNQAIKADGDPELLDDTEFYQHLLKEFLETVDPTSSETAFYALKRLQTKKRKIVDRRASKSRKIRYHVHEKIKNFMAPDPMPLPDMAPRLFSNLFSLKTQTPAS